MTVSGDKELPRRIKWIGRRPLDLAAHPRPEIVALVRIRRSAIADNVPHTDLLVSPEHAIFIDGLLICARQLANGATIRQETNRSFVEYFHIELDNHAILLAEGLTAEGYLDTGNRFFFANTDAPLALYPDLTGRGDYPEREAGSCAPFVWGEAHVRPVWQRLADRAPVLGSPAPRSTTNTDPALRLSTKGTTITPFYSDAERSIFALPSGTAQVRLISRARSGRPRPVPGSRTAASWVFVWQASRFVEAASCGRSHWMVLSLLRAGGTSSATMALSGAGPKGMLHCR